MWMMTDNPVLDAEVHEREESHSNHACCCYCGNEIEEDKCVILDNQNPEESAICDDCIRVMLKPIRKAAETDEGIAKAYMDIKEIFETLTDLTPEKD